MKRFSNSSKGLLQAFPFLQEQKGWERFAKEFDRSECRKARSKASRATRGERESKLICELKTHVSVIRNRHILDSFSFIHDDGTETYSTEEEKQKRILKSAEFLSDQMNLLLTISENGDKARRALTKEIDRKTRKLDQRNITDVFEAFLNFVQRESRLPSKKELNSEANRIEESKKNAPIPGKRKFGDEIKKSDSRADRFIVFHCEEKHGDGMGENWLWHQCQIVRANEWESPRWDEADFSKKILKPAGFAGLPKAGKSQVG